MANDVKLKIDGDASGLIASVKAALAQIEQASKKANITPNVIKPAPAPGAQSFQQAFQATRIQQQKIRDEKDGLDIAVRGLTQKQRELEKIGKMEAASVGNAKQMAYWAAKRNEAEREHQILLGTKKRLEESKPGFKIPTTLSGVAQMLGPVGGTALGAVAIGALIVKASQAIEGVRRFVVEAPMRARETEASAFQVQGQGGQRLESILNGGAAEEFTFNGQRQQAAGIAQGAIQGRYGMKGSSPQAALSALLFGSAATGAFQHGNIMQGIRAAGGRFGFKGMGDEFTAIKNKEQADLQSSQFEALKRGPEGALRTGLANKYLANSARDLAFQRQMGLSDSGFRGEFSDSVHGAGFSQEQGMGMAGSIMGAGGGTRASIGLAGFGLQAQRNLDMTNAGGVIGTLGKNMGGADTTKEAFIKILAEGTKLGLDGSEYRDENRRFTEIAAQAIGQSGASSGAGADQVVSQLSKFFGDKTGRGIEAGKSAYEEFQEKSGAMTGVHGTMRAAGMLSNPLLMKLSRDSRDALFRLKDKYLTTDNGAIQGMADEAGNGTTPQDIIDQMKKVNRSSQNQFKGTDTARNKVESLMKKYGVNNPIDYKGPGASEIKKAFNAFLIKTTREGDENLDPRVNQAYAASQLEGVKLPADLEKDAKRVRELANAGKIEGKGDTGRVGDETERMQAEASKLANGLFVSMRGEITATATDVATFAAECAKLRTVLTGKLSPEEKAKALTDFSAGHPGAIPTSA